MVKDVYIVVAMCNNRGIGIHNKLPWNLKSEMNYFTRISSTTQNKALKNAVIMGRKCWESIPGKYRPLEDRLNIVISTTMPEGLNTDGQVVVRSYQQALDLCDSNDSIETIFSTGGNSIYQSSIDSFRTKRIYLTRILKDFECDVFFPNFDQSIYVKTSIDELNTEKGIDFIYDIYNRQ